MFNEISILGKMVKIQNGASTSLGQKIAEACNIPYVEYKTSETDRPTSYNTMMEAGNKVDRPVEVYYHPPSMNLVIVAANGEKVGIRSNDISVFGIPKGNHEKFVELMKNKCG